MGLFDNTPLPQTPSPEPPGFDLMRDIIMRRIFQNQANPYGMSQGAMNNPSSVFSTGVMGGRLGGVPMSNYSSNGMPATSGGGAMPPPSGGGGFGGGMGPMQSGMQSMGSGGSIGQLLHMLQGTRPLMGQMGGGLPPAGGGAPPPGPMSGAMQPGGGGARRVVGRSPAFDGRTLGYDAPLFPWMPGGGQQAPQQPAPPVQMGGGGGTNFRQSGMSSAPPFQPPSTSFQQSGQNPAPQFKPPAFPAPQQSFSNQPRGQMAQFSNTMAQPRYPAPPFQPPQQQQNQIPGPFQWNPMYMQQNQQGGPPSFPFLSQGYL